MGTTWAHESGEGHAQEDSTSCMKPDASVPEDTSPQPEHDSSKRNSAELTLSGLIWDSDDENSEPEPPRLKLGFDMDEWLMQGQEQIKDPTSGTKITLYPPVSNFEAQ